MGVEVLQKGQVDASQSGPVRRAHRANRAGSRPRSAGETIVLDLNVIHGRPARRKTHSKCDKLQLRLLTLKA